MEYLLHLFILIGIYTMLAQSLNPSAGFGGMVSLAQAGFYGVGAYTASLLTINSNCFYYQCNDSCHTRRTLCSLHQLY